MTIVAIVTIVTVVTIVTIDRCDEVFADRVHGGVVFAEGLRSFVWVVRSTLWIRRELGAVCGPTTQTKPDRHGRHDRHHRHDRHDRHGRHGKPDGVHPMPVGRPRGICTTIWEGGTATAGSATNRQPTLSGRKAGS